MKSHMKIHPAEAALPATEVPSTLRELGLDGGLAAGFELAFRLMGAVEGGRVVGYTLTTSDGQRHALRVEEPASRPDVARAA